MQKDNVLLFPDKCKDQEHEEIEELSEENVLDEFQESIRLFSQRLGGVNIADLEDGDEEALQTATRSLRKEFMKLSTSDIYR